MVGEDVPAILAILRAYDGDLGTVKPRFQVGWRGTTENVMITDEEMDELSNKPAKASRQKENCTDNAQ